MKDEIILDVPFKEKDEAKMLGAYWNPEIKKWYVPQGQNPRPFARWMQGSKQESLEDDRRRNNMDSRQGR